MNPKLIRISLSNAVYFSAISFIIIWLAGFLHGLLEKTTGRLDIGVVIIIVLSLILIMFLLAIIDLFLKEAERARISFWERIMAILLFIFISAVILGILGVLFWWRV